VLVSTTRLAEEVGASASTIRLYADTGHIPCEKTPGGHRRFNLDEAVAAYHRIGNGRVTAPEASDTTQVLDNNPSEGAPAPALTVSEAPDHG